MAEKKMILCDTDVMIDYWNKTNISHTSTKAIVEETIGINNVVLSAITKIELLTGATNKADMKRISKNLDQWIIALLDIDITLTSFSLIEKYSLSHGLALPDSIIAATALSTNLDLFTYNVKDYKFISGLKLFKP